MNPEQIAAKLTEAQIAWLKDPHSASPAQFAQHHADIGKINGLGYLPSRQGSAVLAVLDKGVGNG